MVLPGCAVDPPRDTEDICAIFREYPAWYDYAKAAEKQWGTPAHILMAFVRSESGFRHNARPPRNWFLGFIPLPRKSSAYGYAQAKNAVANGALLAFPCTQQHFYINRGKRQGGADFKCQNGSRNIQVSIDG